jgi:hypothetical protein
MAQALRMEKTKTNTPQPPPCDTIPTLKSHIKLLLFCNPLKCDAYLSSKCAGHGWLPLEYDGSAWEIRVW